MPILVRVHCFLPSSEADDSFASQTSTSASTTRLPPSTTLSCNPTALRTLAPPSLATLLLPRRRLPVAQRARSHREFRRFGSSEGRR
jgi:hypothetical protein